MKTSERFTQPAYAAMERFVTGACQTSICSVEDSPARTSPSQDEAPASMELDRDCGPSLTDSLARYDRATCSWRTSQLCLLGGLDEFLETWPRAGMTQSGTAFPRQPLAPLTDATGFGLWRTPQAGEGNGGGQAMSKRLAGGHSVYLRDQVKEPAMWPTPRAEFDSGKHRGKPDTLHSAVKSWPTPAARDYRSPNKLPYSERGGGTKGEQLPNAVGGSLNPTWVEWLMGYPLGWTDLRDSETP